MRTTNLIATLILLNSLTTANCFANTVEKGPGETRVSSSNQISERCNNEIYFVEFIKAGLKYASDSSEKYLERAKNYAKNNKKVFASINYLLASVEPALTDDFEKADSYIKTAWNLIEKTSPKDKEGFAGSLFLIGSDYQVRPKTEGEKYLFFYNEHCLNTYKEINFSNSKYYILASLKKLRQLNKEENIKEAIKLVNNLLDHFEQEKNVYPKLLRQVANTIAISYDKDFSDEKIAQLVRLLSLCDLPSVECSDLETIPVLETLSYRCAIYSEIELSKKYASRILSIASQHTQLEKQNRRELNTIKNTLKKLAGNQRIVRLPNNVLDDKQTEEALLLLYELSKREGLVTYESVNNLEQLFYFYQKQDSVDKVLPLYKKAMINLEGIMKDPQKGRYAISTKRSLEKGYQNALEAAGKSNDWETLQAEISKESKLITFQDSAVKPKGSNTVDFSKHPGRYVQHLTRLSRKEISAGDVKNGLKHLRESISIYAKIPSGSRDLSSASKALWSTLLNAENNCKDKSLDQELNEVAILYGRKKAVQRRQRYDRTISPIIHYINANQFKKAEKLLKVILKSRESTFGQDDPDLVEILDPLTEIYIKTNNEKEYSISAERALLLSQQQIPLNYSLLQNRIKKMMDQYVVFEDFKKSDSLVEQYKAASIKSKIQRKNTGILNGRRSHHSRTARLRKKQNTPNKAEKPEVDRRLINYYIESLNATKADKLLRKAIAEASDRKKLSRQELCYSAKHLVFLFRTNGEYEKASDLLEYLIDRLKRVRGNGNSVTNEYRLFLSELLLEQSRDQKFSKQSEDLKLRSDKLYKTAIGSLMKAKGKLTDSIKRFKRRREIVLKYPAIARVIFDDSIRYFSNKATESQKRSLKGMIANGRLEIIKGVRSVYVAGLGDGITTIRLDGQSLTQKGLIRLNKGQVSRAIDAFIAALRADLNEEPLNALGESWFIKRKNDDAMDALNLSIEQAPSSRAYALRALINMQNGKTEDAISDAKECIKIVKKPKSDEDKLSYSFALIAQNKLGSALTVLNSIVRKNPQMWRAYYYRSLCNDLRGSKEQANKDRQKMGQIKSAN